jgi:hypothetical protein
MHLDQVLKTNPSARLLISDQLFRKNPMQRGRHLRWSPAKEQVFKCFHSFELGHTNGLGWPASFSEFNLLNATAHHIKPLLKVTQILTTGSVLTTA